MADLNYDVVYLIFEDVRVTDKINQRERSARRLGHEDGQVF